MCHSFSHCILHFMACLPMFLYANFSSNDERAYTTNNTATRPDITFFKQLYLFSNSVNYTVYLAKVGHALSCEQDKSLKSSALKYKHR